MDHLLLLDIETVPGAEDFSTLSTGLQGLWLEKFTKIEPDSAEGPEAFSRRAGIYAEFGKIICISAGYLRQDGDSIHLRIKSFYGDDEAELLLRFLEMVVQFGHHKRDMTFCGHNIREFDIPYICRRAVIHGLALPHALQFYGKKPWEIPLLDTLQLWRFGEHRNYTSLKLLAEILGIDTPKDDIDGSMVAQVYWQEHDLARIVAYCQKDVITVAQLLMRFRRMPLLGQDNITIAE